MARYTKAICRICRREGDKLFLKGYRCFTEKCAFERRSYPPGQHGQRRPKTSDYRVQLREKQKVRRTYGLMEKQFHKTFITAESMKGVTGENLLILLERRLDNVVYRAGLVSSRNQARQLVSHGHFTVNGTPVDIPSFLVRAGDIIAPRARSKKLIPIQAALDAGREGVEWLALDREKVEAQVKQLPTREHITTKIKEQLIVELYSK